MMYFIQLLKEVCCQALANRFHITLETSQIGIERTNSDFEGDFTILLFPLLKLKIGNPQQVGETIAQYITENTSMISRWNVVKGFLNLSLQDSLWITQFEQQLEEKDTAFTTSIGAGKKVMVEFSSPNTNKPLHLGHIRNIFLGYSMSQIFKANGYQVIQANLVNDRGVHICKSMLAWQRYGQNETPESSGMKGDHFVGKYYVLYDQKLKEEYAAWQKTSEAEAVITSQKPEAITEELQKAFWADYKDTYSNTYSFLGLQTREMLKKWEENDGEVRALWQKMNAWVLTGFDESYQKMGVYFDKTYYESDTYLLGKKWIEKGLQQGVFYSKEDGSVWADLTDVGLDHKIVLRSDGTSVYITQDIGTAYLKYEDYGLEKSVYVIGNEQDYHMKVLIAICKKLALPCAEGMYHLSYGMVELPTGKMKSREGTVVDADDLIKEMETTAKELTDELGKTHALAPSEITQLHHIIAMGALKFFLLKVDPVKKMLFNPAESIDLKGYTGAYIQYNHARICSVLRKAIADGWAPKPIPKHYLLQTQEKTLLIQLAQFKQVLQESAEQHNPSLLAQWCYETAKDYSKLWNDLSLLGGEEQDKNFRLQLSQQVALALQKGMQLLGVQCPERM